MTSSLFHGIHVAVVLDGARRRISDVDSVRRVVEAAPALGITTLTLVPLSPAVVPPPTADGPGVRVRVVAGYSRRNALAAARACLAGRPVARDDLAREFGDVDLVIRTGGGRVLDFVLWECARAEFVFTPTRWPQFDGETLAACVDEYRRRRRGFVRAAAVLA